MLRSICAVPYVALGSVSRETATGTGSGGGKVCRVHKNVELVPDNAGMSMYEHYQADSEILPPLSVISSLIRRTLEFRHIKGESVLIIGTPFSNLYIAVDTSAEDLVGPIDHDRIRPPSSKNGLAVGSGSSRFTSWSFSSSL